VKRFADYARETLKNKEKRIKCTKKLYKCIKNRQKEKPLAFPKKESKAAFVGVCECS
jgi:hypothetical protein